MSDNERMERAKRIKRMREGRRGGEDSDPEADATGDEIDEDPDTETDAAGDAASADTPSDAATDTPASSGESAAAEESSTEVNGGETATTEDSEEDPEVQETATTTTDSEQAAETEAAGTADTPDTAENTGDSTAEIPDPEMMEAALEEAAEAPDESDDEAAAPATGIAGEAVETTQEADTRVLEFTLANEQYGLDIRYIEEIVKHENITRVPNTPDFVEGVVDLRGQITTIVNPKVTLNKDDTSRGELIVVFDSDAFDDQNIGWVVDDVSQVSPVHDEQVNDPPMEEEYINGVIDRDEDDQFVIWTTPDLALEEAD